MKHQQSQWKEDVEDLVEKVTFEEAHLAVQQLFEKALDQLAPHEQMLLEAHWAGTSFNDLSHQTDLSPTETEALINRLKKQLVVCLQRSIRARH